MNLALIIIATLVGASIVYWTISRFAPRGAVLGVAVLLYAMGQGIGTLDTGVRMVVLAAGVLKMSGFLGVILGILDLVRKRESTESVKVEIVETDDLSKWQR
jgi:hypothetical protein